jgi:pilus assembly protein CpaF
MEGEQITLQDLFLYQQRGVDRDGRVVGEHVATGATPLFLELFEAEGVPLPLDIFAPTGMRR